MFSMRVTAAGTVRSRLSEPGQVAESMLAKISLVIWASNNGWAESRPVTKGGLSEELAMASIFSAASPACCTRTEVLYSCMQTSTA